MSITSRRSVREKVAATAAASSGETANTDEYTFTPAGDAEHRDLGSGPFQHRRHVRRRAVAADEQDEVHRVVAGDERLDDARGVVGRRLRGSGVAPSNGSTTRIGSKPASRTSRSPMGSAAVEIRASGATAASRSSARRARSGARGSAPRATASATFPSVPLSPTRPPIPATGFTTNPTCMSGPSAASP